MPKTPKGHYRPRLSFLLDHNMHPFLILKITCLIFFDDILSMGTPICSCKGTTDESVSILRSLARDQSNNPKVPIQMVEK